MGVPILDEIVSSFRWLIDFFMSKTPAPIKFVVFLLFLIVFSAFFSVILHFVGIHCDSEGNVQKTPMTSLFTNYNIMTAGNEEFNSSAYFPEEKQAGINLDVIGTTTKADCLYEVCMAENKTIEDKEFLFYPNPDCVTEPFYLFDRGGGDFFGANVGCSACDDYISSATIGVRNIWDSNTYNDYNFNFCYGDAYKIEDYNWWQDLHCRDWWSCNIPENYYWENETGLFTCLNDDVCGENVTENTERITNVDFALLQAGATPFYEGQVSDRSYKKFVGVTCDTDYNPHLTIAGIKIFDYKIWLMIMVIYVLAMVLIYLRPQK